MFEAGPPFHKGSAPQAGRVGVSGNALVSDPLSRPCFEWPFGRDKNGYGTCYNRHTGKNERAHRAAYETAVEPIPNGLYVLHKCDNPPCINPDHLFVGTQADNIADMVSKGRHNPYNVNKTHCPKGHEYSPENTRVNKRKRYCRECQRAIDRGRAR